MKDNVRAYPSIYLNKSWEINYWCQKLNLRADELKEMIRKVGPALDDILRLAHYKK